ncbi:MAG: hypothetical protein JNL01_03655 [Bdellovibrionales bacterium]|nr:hypothetical protein [Bdellovibrionales bacterium]
MSFIAAFSVLLSASSAFAYVPPSQYILKSWVKSRNSVGVFRVRSNVIAYDNGKPTESTFRQLTVFDPKTKSLRARAYDLSGRELYSVERRIPDAVSATNGGGDHLPVVGALLFDRDLDGVSAILRSGGIPIRTEAELVQMKDENERRASEVQSFARYRGAVAWVIGPGVSDLVWPQLWFEKDGFLPIRLIQKSEEGTVDVKFEAFRFSGPVGFPGVVSVGTASKAKEEDPRLIWFKEEVTEFTTAGDPKELKGSGSAGFTSEGNQVEGRLKDAIRRYFSVLR